uniref:Uncharacterized protein n=1 Tax=Arundo donax TaxID=35708 RepID=A0A0A8YWB7_ARUDO
MMHLISVRSCIPNYIFLCHNASLPYITKSFLFLYSIDENYMTFKNLSGQTSSDLTTSPLIHAKYLNDHIKYYH